VLLNLVDFSDGYVKRNFRSALFSMVIRKLQKLDNRNY
jgi:hypothetical protein